MSGTTVKTAPAETSTGKTKKPAASKKVAKTTARKTRSSTATVKKKSVTKKTVTKKSAVKKPPARKASKKATGRRGITISQKQETPASIQTSPGNANSTPEDSKSLSWMSAQAANALKAVKASQAEKGQAVLARTRKQATETHLDDDSLIKIAAEMPVDNDALVEFSTEQPLEDDPRKPAAASPAGAAAMDGTNTIEDSPGDSHVTSEPAMAVVETADATLPAEQITKIATPPPPQQPVKHSAALQLTLAAGLLFAALVLGYSFWPVSDDNSEVVATPESNEVEAPATPDDPVDIQDTSTNVATVPAAEPRHEPTEINNDWTPSKTPNAWEQPNQPQTAAIPATTQPEPVPEPAPVGSAPVVAAEPEPAPVESAPVVAAEPEPAPVESVPVVAAEPEPAPLESVPAVAGQAPQPAVPAQPDRRAPAQGYYPQQRQPTYPPYYYR